MSTLMTATISRWQFSASPQSYKSATGNPDILVTPTEAKSIKLGWRKPLPFLARINGEPAEPWRINMMPVGDGSLYLHGDV